jgi:hypothetical protein
MNTEYTNKLLIYKNYNKIYKHKVVYGDIKKLMLDK